MTATDLRMLVDIFKETASAHDRFAQNGLNSVALAADAISRATRAGRKVLAFGNGGSARDAEHLVAELMGRFEKDRQGLPAVALSSNSSVLTAIANDYGYDQVFSRQIEALGLEGDVSFGISTSGRSRNVEAALEAAKTRGLVTIAMTGRDGGLMGKHADIHINVTETSTARIQEVHRTIMHAMCLLIERDLT